MSNETKPKTKRRTKTGKPRPSGVTVTMTKGGGFTMRAYGPDAPDLRTVIPELLGTRPTSPSDGYARPAETGRAARPSRTGS